MVDGREARLFWREGDGQLAMCVLEGEVEKLLRDLHDGHGHFAAGVTAGHAHGQYFRPTRQKDIGRWVASCKPCQRMTQIQRCGETRAIILFSRIDMVGMDFIGPMNPPCEGTEAIYIFLVVDYFSRFALGTALEKADQQSTLHPFVDKVVPILGWPKSVYADNGSHFTGAAIQKMWADDGVIYLFAAISHPQSVGFSEPYVQMVMERIRLRCISAGTSRNWGLLLNDALIDINTRSTRIHGYTPSKILLGFNAATSRRPVISDHTSIGDARNNWTRGDQVAEPGKDIIHVGMDIRDE